MYTRTETKKVRVGTVEIGGGAPVVIQSMTTTDPRDAAATLRQIEELAAAGCELVRVAVPTKESAVALKEVVEKSPLPVVADIHFDYRLALTALDSGVHKLRINPGNIGSPERVAKIVEAAAKKKVPIRIGINAGSLEKSLLKKHGGPTAEALVESALASVQLVEKMGFNDLVVSIKSSSVPLTIRAYKMLAAKVRYPLHLGITEAGTLFAGTIASAVGIGALLAEGLGDTIRVSLTASPVEEIRVAKQILTALELRTFGPRVISCPTCGRCQIDLISLAGEIERRVEHIREPLTLAVMGCVVNGPGEAREADLGMAGGKNQGLIFCRGQAVKKVPADKLADEFMGYLEDFVAGQGKERSAK